MKKGYKVLALTLLKEILNNAHIIKENVKNQVEVSEKNWLNYLAILPFCEGCEVKKELEKEENINKIRKIFENSCLGCDKCDMGELCN